MRLWFYEDISLEEINKKRENTLLDLLDIKVQQLGDNFLIGTMPVDHRTFQPHKIMHGGASCVLAESLGSIASNLIIDPESFMAVGQSISTQHLRPATQKQVTGKATAIHIGKKSHVWNIDIFDHQDKLISSTRLTMAIIEKR